MIWSALSTETLYKVKEEFDKHVRELSKDMSDMEQRAVIDEILCHMDQINQELEKKS